MEGLEGVGLLPHTHEGDGPARHLPHREGSSAAGIAVHLGQDHGIDADGGVELVGHRDGVLARHGVHDQEHVMRPGLLLDGAELVEHLLVDVKASRRVENERRETPLGRLVAGRAADVHGLPRFLAQHRNAELLAEPPQLLHRSGTVDVGRGEDGMLPLLLEVTGELGGGRGLA